MAIWLENHPINSQFAVIAIGLA